MKISKINSNSNILFGAIKKVPTNSGYQVFDDDILVENVSFNMQKRTLRKDVFNKNGTKDSVEENMF